MASNERKTLKKHSLSRILTLVNNSVQRYLRWVLYRQFQSADVRRILAMNITMIPDPWAKSWLQRVGIIVAKSWDRTLVALLCTRTKTRRLSFFCRSWPLLISLELFFDLFVPFGRAVETQNVLQRWYWHLRGMWPIFVTLLNSGDVL